MTRAEYNSRPGRSSSWIRPVKRLAIYLRDDFRCAYCGTDLREVEPHQMGLDHLCPQSAGGSNDATNLVTTCRSCNSSRQDRPWRQVAMGGAVDRIVKLRRRKLNLKLAEQIHAGHAPWPSA